MIIKFLIFALFVQSAYAQDTSSSPQIELEKKHNQEIKHTTDENTNQVTETTGPEENSIDQQVFESESVEQSSQHLHLPPEENTPNFDSNHEHYQFEIKAVQPVLNGDDKLLNEHSNEQKPLEIATNYDHNHNIPTEHLEDFLEEFKEASSEVFNNELKNTLDSVTATPEIVNNDVMDESKDLGNLEYENLEDNNEVKSDSETPPVRLKIMAGNRELGDLFMNEEELMTDSSDDDIADDTISELNDEKIEVDPQTKLAKELYEKARVILRKRSTSSSAPAYSTAYELIAQAAKLNYAPALEDVAYAYLFGRHFRQNVTKAMVMFQDLASQGSPGAQMGLGFIYAIGLGVPSSQAKAIIYYNFAALGGNPFAQMALGYRHKYGYSLEQSCESSLTYYRRVARIVAQEVRQSASTDGPGVIQRIRLLDLAEPPQTPPPAPSSGAENSESTASSASVVLDKDLLKYYKFLADKGDVQAQVGLGQLLYQGGRGVAPDPAEAARLFTAAARDSGNAYAQAYLGKMYLEGNEALRQNNETALDYFRKSAEQNNPMGQTGLGLIYLYGHGVPADAQKAFAYFKLAADQGGPEAQLNIANMYFTGTGVAANYKHALKYYTLASQSGNLLAFFNLGQMHAVGLGAMRSCYTAMELFKNVAERGFWGRMLMEAYEAYKAEDMGSALVIYAFLGEIGYETGQSNAAFILEKESVNWFPHNESLSRAFLLWKRAAIQGYPMARIKLGDFHYYGYGTPVDFEAAAQNYRLAYEAQNSARAVFNLAFMHEKGFGLKKDLHLARRYYDMALEASPDAYIPVTLALTKLAVLLYYEQVAKLNFKEILAKTYDIEHYLPQDWDLYAILGFAFLLGTLIYFRRTQRA